MIPRLPVLLILGLGIPSAESGDTRGKRLWKWSGAALATANAADTMTSIGRYDRCAIPDPAPASAGDAQGGLRQFCHGGRNRRCGGVE